ncbi:MAG: MFS transporter [Actinomycetaceae bacterium]|nr:MFS transporter [Actinomycetaceae bacterium]
MATHDNKDVVTEQHSTWNELSEEERSTVKRAATASFLGNFVEWFDYGSYGYFAIAISEVFFATEDKQVALIETFAVFAISFLLRPVGAIFWGHMGDKKGRKWSLAASIMLMTGATFFIAFIPGYATIGIFAPLLLLLLRSVQGFSASGEYAGAATFLAEYAPMERRGIYCSLVPASTASGLLLAAVINASFEHLLTTEQVISWGWRVPFAMSLPLGLIALYLWMHLEDSPTYAKLQEQIEKKMKAGETARPIRDLFVNHWRETLIGFGVSALNAVGFYMVLVYMPTYLNEEVKISSDTASIITAATLVFYIACIFYMGHLSDTFGRKKMLIAASVGFIVLAIPGFMLLGTKSIVVILIVELIFCATLTINDGTLSSFLTETFPTEVRYSGFAFSFNMANVVFGGTAPMISTWLIRVTGSDLTPAFYLMLVAAFALGAMMASKDHSNKDLGTI